MQIEAAPPALLLVQHLRCRGTMLAHLPSLAALESDDDLHLAAEMGLARLRSQAAVVRTLADQVEHVSRAGDAEGLGEQLVEEIARLGCRLLEAAQSLAAATRRGDSGVFARVRSADTGVPMADRFDERAHLASSPR